jgi:hypothetical protein
MSRFTNPMEKGLSSKQILTLILYLIFLAASVWACGESLARSYELPKTICYIIGLSAMLGASFCLSMIHKSISPGYLNNRTWWLIIGTIGFLFFWFVSFVSNTHNIYLVGMIDETRQEELRNVRNQLELIKDKSITEFYGAEEKFKAEIEVEIENMKYEIQNEGNLGHGSKTDSIMVRIEKLIGSEVDKLDPTSNSRIDLRDHADQQASKIRKQAEIKLSEISAIINELERFIKQDKYKNTMLDLEATIDNYSQLDEAKIKSTLRNSYSYYNKCYEYIGQLYENPLLKGRANLVINPLPTVPESIELERISWSWKQFIKGNYEKFNFFLAIIWALIIDIACFILFYFGVLPSDNE